MAFWSMCISTGLLVALINVNVVSNLLETDMSLRISQIGCNSSRTIKGNQTGLLWADPSIRKGNVQVTWLLQGVDKPGPKRTAAAKFGSHQSVLRYRYRTHSLHRLCQVQHRWIQWTEAAGRPPSGWPSHLDPRPCSSLTFADVRHAA